METRNASAAKGKSEGVGLEELSKCKEILKRERNDVKVSTPPLKLVLNDKEEKTTICRTLAVATRKIEVVSEAYVEKALRQFWQETKIQNMRNTDSYCWTVLSDTIRN